MRKGLPYVPPKKKVVAQAMPALLSHLQSTATAISQRSCLTCLLCKAADPYLTPPRYIGAEAPQAGWPLECLVVLE